MEAAVLPTFNAVPLGLHRMAGRPFPGDLDVDLDIELGGRLMHQHTVRLLDPVPLHRSVRIMVTMPSEAAADPSVILRRDDAQISSVVFLSSVWMGVGGLAVLGARHFFDDPSERHFQVSMHGPSPDDQ